MVPGLPGPEPLPPGATNKGPDDDHRHPEHDEAEQKRSNRKLPLLPGVIAAAQRIGIDIRNRHQADDDQGRHYYACDPGIEINQHLLQSEEVPRRFGRIHGQVGIGGLFEWRTERDGPDHQNDGHNHRRQKFHAQQKGPDVDFFLPPGTERPSLAVVSLGHGGTGFKLTDQLIVGARLLPRQIAVEEEQRNQAHDGHVIGCRTNLPKLSPVHLLLRLLLR